jgi:hypothetical protein
MSANGGPSGQIVSRGMAGIGAELPMQPEAVEWRNCPKCAIRERTLDHSVGRRMHFRFRGWPDWGPLMRTHQAYGVAGMPPSGGPAKLRWVTGSLVVGLSYALSYVYLRKSGDTAVPNSMCLRIRPTSRAALIGAGSF